MSQTFTARTVADFLAAVPAISGYRARNSVVCVLHSGRMAEAAFRLDLPTRHRQSDYRAVCDAAVALAARSRGVDRVSPVIYTDCSFEAEHGIPWVRFARMLNERIHRSGLGIVGAYCVASDGWGDYFEVGGPQHGHPLEEIEASPLAAELPHVAELESIARLPAPHPLVTAGLNASLGCLAAHPDPVDHVEACLEREPDLTALATFIALAQSPANRDTMMAQIAFGRIVGEAYASGNAAMHAIQNETGKTMDEVVAGEIAAGRQSLDDELLTLLWGKGRKRPSIERIERARGWLTTAAANIEPALRPPLLCILAWLTWARGLSTVAAAYVDAALDLEPRYGMAQVLAQLFDTGAVPEWAPPG